MTKILNGISAEEAEVYIGKIKADNPDSEIDEITLTAVGDDVDVNYTSHPIPFQRIRRITGYLVGTVDRFNDAKRAEESQRVKHSI